MAFARGQREADSPPPADEDDMPATERELAEDAQWKVIQKNTFTRWTNEHLKKAQKNIADLEFDLGDGLRLIALVEVLSGKKFKHINKRPSFRHQKLENVSMALKFLEDDEGIKIVNIDSTDIVDSNLKLILGLIWTLILHYSISMPMWEGEEDQPHREAGAKEGPTPKQRLLIWVQNKLPDLPIGNFTTDWNDGRAIGALVDAVGPGLCPDWQDWDPSQAKRNATEAMDLAEKWLDVPQLIRPEEMTNPKVDELSMMTYLSQFPNAKLRADAPLRPRTNAARVRAYGPGLEPTGNCKGRPANFKVETFAGGKGELKITVLNPRGQPEPCQVVFNNDRNLTYACQYVPTMEGDYTVIITFAGKEIPKSPFKVKVEGAAGDASKVRAAGPGLAPTGVQNGKKTFFEVYVDGAGVGNVEVVIVDPQGRKDTTKPRVAKTTDTTFYVEYLPKDVGRYTVHIYFAGKEIPNSPYSVGVAQPVESKKCYATGRGVQPRGIRVKDIADFKVHTEGAGEGELKGSLVLPGGKEEPIRFKSAAPNVYEAAYIPATPGDYTLNVTYGGGHITKSPFKINVGKHIVSNIRAYGPGLEGGIANKPADFVVETNGETGALGFAVEGPSQAKIDCKDNGDGSANVSYLPTAPGEYAVHILCNNEDIPNSPYMAQIGPATKDFFPEKVVASGPGLQPKGLVVGKPAPFTIDTTAAGLAPLRVVGQDANGQPIDVQIKDNKDGTYSCQYTPKSPVKHTIFVTYGGVSVPNSPFMVGISPASHPEKVRVYGPGIEKSVKCFHPTHFFVDAKEAGPGDVAIALTDDRGSDVPVKATDNGSGIFRIEYEPKSIGSIKASVFFAEQEIPTSPFKVNVEPNIDVSKVKVEGLEPKIQVNKEQHFSVITGLAGKAPVSVNIRSPSGKAIMPIVEETPNGYAGRFTLTEVGPHDVSVSFGGQPVPRSPFKVTAVPAPAPPAPVAEPKVAPAVSPKPVQAALPKQPHETVQAVKALPQQQQAGVGDQRPVAEEPVIAGKQQPKQQEAVKPPSNACKVKAYGEGLERGVTTKPAEFTIDTREAGPGGLGLTIEGPIEARMEARDNGDGTCRVSYYPTVAGDYKIGVFYCNEPIPNSPWVARIEPGKVLDLSGVKAYGPGLQSTGVFLDSTTDFTVDAKSVTSTGEGKVRAIVTGPTGTKTDTTVVSAGDGTYNVSYLPYEQGPHSIDVTYEGLPIPKSPFPVKVTPGNDPSRVKAQGPGLTKGYTNQPQTFTVSTRGAGQGNLGIAVEGPSKAEVQCEDNHDGTCTVTYVPTKAGPYDVGIKFADKHVPGSPFRVPIEDVVDPSKCRAYGPGLNPEGVRATLPASFTVDCTEAGVAPLEVTYDDGHGGQRRPAEIKKVQEGLYQATYYPAEKGQSNIDVLYAGKHVPGSPFKQKVLPSHDASRVRVTGDGVKDAVPASLPTSFVVDTKDAGVADVSVAVQAPDGSQLRPVVHDNHDGTVTVTYTPEDVGKYQAKVKFGGEPVPGSPFAVTAVPSGDASKCRIKDDPPKKRVVVGEECVITVNTAAAGQGNVTCRIRTPTDTDADIDIEDNGDGTVSIHYTPKTPGAYQISIKFGGVTIPNGDYVVQAVPAEDFVDEGQIAPSQVNGFHAAPKGNVFHPVDFVIPVGPVFRNVDAEIHSPSGHVSKPEIVDNGDGSVTIKFQPTETGVHQLHVSYNGSPIEGSPYDFFVEAINSSAVTAYGPGLSYGIAGQPCTFTIDTKNAGAGGLSLAVEGPSKAEISCVDNGDGTCSVSFVPTVAGEYKAAVKVNGKDVPGSPFTVKVAPHPENRNKAQVSMGASEFQLSVNEYDIASLTADIVAPSGRQEPCTLKKLPNGHLGIAFTPRETGTHLVNVYRDGRHIANSPFKINVTPNEKGNASKVKVYGKGLSEGLANEDNEFVIDTKDAGYGGLSISVEGPSKAEIDCKDQADGSCLVSYKPTEPGSYVVNIKFADEHVPGSPFTCKIGGSSAAKQTEELTRQQKAVDVMHVGSVCEVNLKVPGSDPMDMVASVTSPSGTTELCDIIDQRTDLYTIKFVPKEMGVHTVSVKHKGSHVPGSPFQFTVGPITDGGAHRVRAAGPGLERGEVEVLNEFNVYTREAGAGGLAISVEGPSKAEIHFEDKRDGSCVVGYTCTEPGEYVVSIKFNDQHIPDSPFRVPVLPHSGDARKLTVQSLQQKGLEIGRPCAFTVTFNGAQGNLQARVVAPSGAEDEALIQALDDSGGHFAIRFIPRENGVHYVHVLLNGNHIRGSPFRVLVGESDPDPGLVTASGEGLVRGETYHPAKFVVSTVGAGASTLAVTVDGPSKVQLQAQEVPEGYEFTYTPTAPGDYLIHIKYGGNCHIAGSPYKAKITGTGEHSHHIEHSHCVVETAKKSTDLVARVPKFNSDASKVSSKGLGLNKAFVNKKAQFTVDTSLAGNNMLFVGVIGPVGAPPCDEVIIKNQNGTNQYNVSYTVKQKGKHLLIVKWGDEHVPGSPFQIDVV